MSLTLGEKLRQAREERGITLSEVAEQTRISPIYLEAIDNDDYRRLPGGIFNRGFVKSYAKYVGLNEQEALLDYSRLQNELETPQEVETRIYKPEVLTDDRSATSMIPTILTAAVILAVMTGGILFLVNYLRRPSEPVTDTRVPTNQNSEPPMSEDGGPGPRGTPEIDIASATIELTAPSQPVKIIATLDGEPPKASTVTGAAAATFTPKESLTLNYLRWNASNVQLTINGKTITLPAGPLDPKDKDRIVFTISKENIAQIWTSGAISPDLSGSSDANTQPTPAPARPTPLPTPTPQANTARTPGPAGTPRPVATRPPSNGTQ